MRICITSNGPSLESLVDPRFGRCLYFIFVEDDDLEKIKVISNEGIEAIRGAGIQSAQTVVDQKAEAVISGNIGPNSFLVLNSSNIKVFQAPQGIKIKDALLLFKENKLLEISQPVRSGFGFSDNGKGMGRGMGRGRRR